MTKTIEQLEARNVELEKEVARLKVESRDACMGLSDYYGRKLAIAEEHNLRMWEFIKDVAVNWDCDNDAHKYGTPCRSCEAEKILSIPASTEALDKYVAEKVKELKFPDSSVPNVECGMFHRTNP